MRVFIVRHGKTKSNEKRLLQGHSKTVLSEEGKTQAEAVADRLLNVEPDLIITSDLPRARETADAIARKHPGVEVVEDTLLRERDMGEFEGKPVDEAFGGPVEQYAHPDYRPPGGESNREMEKRAEEFYGFLRGLEEGTVIVVTHGGMVRYLVKAITGREIGFRTKNTGVTEVILGEKPELICVNCDKHLV